MLYEYDIIDCKQKLIGTMSFSDSTFPSREDVISYNGKLFRVKGLRFTKNEFTEDKTLVNIVVEKIIENEMIF